MGRKKIEREEVHITTVRLSDEEWEKVSGIVRMYSDLGVTHSGVVGMLVKKGLKLLNAERIANETGV